jgi:chorismate synthase
VDRRLDGRDRGAASIQSAKGMQFGDAFAPPTNAGALHDPIVVRDGRLARTRNRAAVWRAA